jgi:cyclopropane-fatty-acyl-phospholipid synthase
MRHRPALRKVGRPGIALPHAGRRPVSRPASSGYILAMASRDDIDFSYTLTDRLFRLSVGELADFSGAKYDGDFSLTLEEAQRRKHEFVVAQLGVPSGGRIIDLGCGWGAMLAFFRARGIPGVGVTLSRGQQEADRRHGLDVQLMDARTVTAATFGTFDGAISLGAFEHFCSIEEWQAGRQDAIYAAFFRNVASLLPPGGRFFLQTMVFGPNMIPYEAIDMHAPHLSDGHVLALLQKTFPGSWLPDGSEQIERNAESHFRLVAKESGRLDYIETIRQWRARFRQRSWRKLLLYVRLVPRYLTSHDFRQAFVSGISANTIAFERQLFEHYRLVFEKRREPA